MHEAYRAYEAYEVPRSPYALRPSFYSAAPYSRSPASPRPGTM